MAEDPNPTLRVRADETLHISSVGILRQDGQPVAAVAPDVEPAFGAELVRRWNAFPALPLSASEQAARESRLRERIARLRLALQTIAAHHTSLPWTADRARRALEEDQDME